MTRKKARGPRGPYWDRVHTIVRCSFGHDVGAGLLVRFGNPGLGGKRPATCAPCMATHYGQHPPTENAGRDVWSLRLPESDR